MLSKEDFTKINSKIPDGILDFIIRLTEKKIKNFCNIEAVPDQLKETQMQMCIDLYDVRYKTNSNSNNTEESQSSNQKYIKSIKRGDTQIEFSSEAESLENEKRLLKELINSDNFLFNYENELYDFRKLRW